MRPAPFEYVEAESVRHAALLSQRHDVAILAGGQSLIAAMNRRSSTPGMVVDINGLAELRTLHVDEHVALVRLGALVTHDEIANHPLLKRHIADLSDAAAVIGCQHIRNWGTIGGSLSLGHPSAEYGAVMALHGARMILQDSESRTRALSAEQWFVGAFETALRKGEILTHVELPLFGQRSGSAFAEFTQQTFDWAVAGMAAVVQQELDGTLKSMCLVGIGVGPIPFLFKEIQHLLQGEAVPSQALLQTVADAVRHELRELGPTMIDEYVIDIAGWVAPLAIKTAWERASVAQAS
jgi:carbon-monoxide dehydrogenase medium subunit